SLYLLFFFINRRRHTKFPREWSSDVCSSDLAIHDTTYGLVLAGEIRARAIVWQQPVISDAQARRIVSEASRLRGRASAACDARSARNLRYRASLLETRLVDRGWPDAAAGLLSLPRAA